jgi:hypothetical protein
MKKLLFTLLLAAFCLPLFANNITISNPSLTTGNGNEGYSFVTFDLSWENSWRLSSGASNWDAAWVFVKYRVGSGEWLPANLHNTGHIAGTGTPADITVGLVDDTLAFHADFNPGRRLCVPEQCWHGYVHEHGPEAALGLRRRWYCQWHERRSEGVCH